MSHSFGRQRGTKGCRDAFWTSECSSWRFRVVQICCVISPQHLCSRSSCFSLPYGFSHVLSARWQSSLPACVPSSWGTFSPHPVPVCGHLPQRTSEHCCKEQFFPSALAFRGRQFFLATSCLHASFSAIRQPSGTVSGCMEPNPPLIPGAEAGGLFQMSSDLSALHRRIAERKQAGACSFTSIPLIFNSQAAGVEQFGCSCILRGATRFCSDATSRCAEASPSCPPAALPDAS